MKTHFIQTGCLIIGILCFIYYAGILIYAGIRTSISWIWLLAGALFLFLWRALLYQQNHPDSVLHYVTAGLGILIAIGICVVVLLGSRIVSAMMVQPVQGLDYVIVLGAQVKGRKPSRSLRMRLDCALDYAKENPETIFVLSGGQGPDEEISEAACMYNYLTQQGLSPERILLEDTSTTTRENLCSSDQLYGLADQQVGILSNNFHIYRALKQARESGYQHVYGIPAASDYYMQIHNTLREILALFKPGF